MKKEEERRQNAQKEEPLRLAGRLLQGHWSAPPLVWSTNDHFHTPKWPPLLLGLMIFDSTVWSSLKSTSGSQEAYKFNLIFSVRHNPLGRYVVKCHAKALKR